MNPSVHHMPGNYNQISLLDEETMNMLREYAEGNPEILQDILDSFEPEGSGLIRDLEAALELNNSEALRIAAHSLAGISGSIGAVRLRKICADTENAIKSGDTETAFTLAEIIPENFGKVIKLLKTI